MFTALLLTSTLVFAQTQQTVKVPGKEAPKVAELGRAVGDDCTNPIVVDRNGVL